MAEKRTRSNKKLKPPAKEPIRRKGRDYEVEFDRVFLGKVKLEDAMVKAGIKHFTVKTKIQD